METSKATTAVKVENNATTGKNNGEATVAGKAARGVEETQPAVTQG